MHGASKRGLPIYSVSPRVFEMDAQDMFSQCELGGAVPFEARLAGRKRCVNVDIRGALAAPVDERRRNADG